ncbi:Uncharacterised protein [uncultured archaeon]|nr:Uncharacterised protein [uncultured archaeon]
MKKAIFALTTALALTSPGLNLEAMAGNPFIETQKRVSQGQEKANYNSQPQTQYKTNKNPFIAAQEKTKTPVQYETPIQEKQIIVYRNEPVEGKVIDLTTRTEKYIRNANLEESVGVPAPPVAQEYPASQYTTEQPGACKRVQSIPEVCRPVQTTPMLIQGAPAAQPCQQNIYAPTIVLPGTTIDSQSFMQYPYIIGKNCGRPFGGLFYGIGKALKWLTIGPNCIPGCFEQGFGYGGFSGYMGRPGCIGPGFGGYMGRPGCVGPGYGLGNFGFGNFNSGFGQVHRPIPYPPQRIAPRPPCPPPHMTPRPMPRPQLPPPHMTPRPMPGKGMPMPGPYRR